VTEQHALLQIDAVTTSFPGVRALDNATLRSRCPRGTRFIVEIVKAQVSLPKDLAIR
jgi:hypothetical protein